MRALLLLHSSLYSIRNHLSQKKWQHRCLLAKTVKLTIWDKQTRDYTLKLCVCDVFLLHFCSGMLITVDFKWRNDVIWTRLWHATSLFYNMLSYDIVLIDFQLAAVVASVGIFWHLCRTVHSRYWYLDQCVHCPAPLLWCRNVLDWKCLGSEVSDPRSDYHVLQPAHIYFLFQRKMTYDYLAIKYIKMPLQNH